VLLEDNSGILNVTLMKNTSICMVSLASKMILRPIDSKAYPMHPEGVCFSVVCIVEHQNIRYCVHR
jgi:hypothetical protein